MRFWEIDAVRGIAVILMVLFNYAFALDYLRIYTLTEGWGFWWLFPRIVAGTFIFLAGISLTISCSRNGKTSRFRRFHFDLTSEVRTKSSSESGCP